MNTGKATAALRFIAGHVLALALSLLIAALIAAPLTVATLYLGLPVLVPDLDTHSGPGHGAAVFLIASAAFLAWFAIAFVVACRWALRRLDERLLA